MIHVSNVKSKLDLVSSALSQPCDKQVRRSSLFHCLEPAVGCLGPVLRTVDHTSSITCRYFPAYYTGTKLYCLVTEAHRCEKLAQSFYAVCPAENRTHDLLIASPTLYHSATTQHDTCTLRKYLLQYY